MARLRRARDSQVPFAVLDAVSVGFAMRRRRGSYILALAIEFQLSDAQRTPDWSQSDECVDVDLRPRGVQWSSQREMAIH